MSLVVGVELIDSLPVGNGLVADAFLLEDPRYHRLVAAYFDRIAKESELSPEAGAPVSGDATWANATAADTK